MLKRIIGLIIQTRKTQKWLKYPCVLVLALILGCMALVEYTVKTYGEAALLTTGNKKYALHTVKKNEYFILWLSLLVSLEF